MPIILIAGVLVLGAVFLGRGTARASTGPRGPSTGPRGPTPPRPEPPNPGRPPAGTKPTDAARWQEYADSARSWWDLGNDVVATFTKESPQGSRPSGTQGV